MAANDDDLFMTRRLNVMPKTTDQHLIARSDKSEAEVTNKRLRSRYCLKSPRKNLDVLFIALLTPYLAALAELLQKMLCYNCCVVNVFQFCYMVLRLVH